jgi:hypothetical protein
VNDPLASLRVAAEIRRPVEAALLTTVVLLAALLRLADLRHAPPGVHLDAAVNAWSAHCLLKEGKDAAGEPWPLFQYRAYGESRSTLALYALLPFQALGGLSRVTTILPTAFGGVLSVLCLWYVGRRLFSPAVGLVAAAMLAVTPWHVFLSRYGQEAGLVPLLVAGPMATLIWAGLPLTDDDARPTPLRAAIAGASIGIACYGFLAVRLALPALVAIAVLACWRRWADLAATHVGRKALLALGIGLSVTLGPLVVRHFTDPVMSERARGMVLWAPSDPLLVRVGKVQLRYFAHFGTDFLFARGDTYYWNSVPGTAPLSWYMLPLLVAGTISSISDARRSSSARVALAWLAAYPVADSLAAHPSLHALRSAPGLCGLVLLAGLGTCRIGAWLARRGRTAAAAFGITVLLAGGVATVRFLGTYFGDYSRGPRAYVNWSQDLLDACAWLRPRLDALDAVFITRETAVGLHAYAVVALGLDYSPHRWFAEDRRVIEVNGVQYCAGFGKIQFLLGNSVDQVFARLRAEGRVHRAAFVLRPGETTELEPSFAVRLPNGQPSLLVYETSF